MEFSKRLDLFGDEIFAALNERKVALEAQGRTIYNLSVGTPATLGADKPALCSLILRSLHDG